MPVKLTSGAISRIMSGKCTSDDLKPVLQVIFISSASPTIENKQLYAVMLSDGSHKLVGLIYDALIESNKLQKGSIVQLTNFRLTQRSITNGEMRSAILGLDLTVIHSKCGIIGDPKLLLEAPLVERATPTIPNKDHAYTHHVEEPPTSKQKKDHVDSHLNENIDDSRHVEEPPTTKQKPSTVTQNKTNTVIGVNLTPEAITKIMADKCSSTDLKPVVQVTKISSGRISTKHDKKCYRKVVLSDGSSSHNGCIADGIFISNKLQKGSIIQLTKFCFTNFSIYGDIRVLLIDDLNLLHSKCDIIVNPEPFPRNDIPLVERSTFPVTDDDHVDVSQSQESVTSKENCSDTQSRKWKHQSSNKTLEFDTTEDVDNSHNAPPITDEDHVDVSRLQEPVTSKENCSEIQSRKRKHQSSNKTPEFDTNEDADNSHNSQEPPATTQKCSSHSLTQSRIQKHQTSNDNISKVVDVFKMTRMMMEKNKQDDVGACFKKFEKNKEVDVGSKKLEALKQDVSKMTRMVLEKTKEKYVGACFKRLGVIEEDVSKLTRMLMEKNIEDDVGACFKKLEILEEDVSKLTRMMMEKSKDDVGACIEKLDKLGWGAEEPIYDTALLLFGQSADYRKLWLHLKPESCGKWVKNAGNMFGLLD